MNRKNIISELKSPTLVSEDPRDPAGASVEEANDQCGLDAEENPPTGEHMPYSCDKRCF